MHASIVALVVLATLFVGYTAHADVSAGENQVTCDTSGHVGADTDNPTAPDTDTPVPVCTGLPV